VGRVAIYGPPRHLLARPPRRSLARAGGSRSASGGESDRDALVNERPLVPNAAEEPEELFEQ